MGCCSLSIHETNNPVGGGENDINIYHLIKGKTKTKETQGGSGTKEADGSPGAGPAMHAG